MPVIALISSYHLHYSPRPCCIVDTVSQEGKAVKSHRTKIINPRNNVICKCFLKFKFLRVINIGKSLHKHIYTSVIIPNEAITIYVFLLVYIQALLNLNLILLDLFVR